MKLIAKFDGLLNKLNQHGEEYGFPFVLFSLFMILNYALDIPWWYIFQQDKSNPFFKFQVISFALAIIFTLRKFWPSSIKKFYVLGWYAFVIWVYPFCHTLYFLNYPEFSQMMVLDTLAIIFTLILIVDWLSFAVTIIVGVSLGLLVHYINYGKVYMDANTLSSIASNYIWVIFTGILFSHNAARYHKNLLLQRKLASIRTVASMAHELRNPLATIRISTRGIKRYNDILMENYYAAQKANLGTPELPDIELMERVFKNVEAEINFSNTMIDTLLANTKEMATQPAAAGSNQIAQCVQAAIARYPFASDDERKLVQVDLAHDFTYQGDDLMVTHVIFNLLKNALLVIQEQHKGHIFISLETPAEGKYNLLHFKDTAKGMSEKTRAKIFDSFYTESTSGTGVGLAFCTMIMKGLRGKIEVKSELGVFTEFVLSFPK